VRIRRGRAAVMDIFAADRSLEWDVTVPMNGTGRRDQQSSRARRPACGQCDARCDVHRAGTILTRPRVSGTVREKARWRRFGLHRRAFEKRADLPTLMLQPSALPDFRESHSRKAREAEGFFFRPRLARKDGAGCAVEALNPGFGRGSYLPQRRRDAETEILHRRHEEI